MHEPASAPIRPGDLKASAQALAELLAAHPSGAKSGGGSLHRGLPEEVRDRFIAIRTALVQTGICDPVLSRFDTATVAQATNEEIAEQLRQVAASL